MDARIESLWRALVDAAEVGCSSLGPSTLRCHPAYLVWLKSTRDPRYPGRYARYVFDPSPLDMRSGHVLGYPVRLDVSNRHATPVVVSPRETTHPA